MRVRVVAGVLCLLAAAVGAVVGAALFTTAGAIILGSAEVAGLGYALLKIEERAR